MANPFTDVRNAVWTTLEASSAFTTLVPTHNRLKLDQKRGRKRGTPRYAAGPVVRIEPAMGQFNPHMDSSASMVTYVLTFEFLHQDERPDDLDDVMWATLRAMAAAFAKTSTVRSLTFNDKTYVIDCRLRQYEEKFGRGNTKEQTEKWVALWSFEVDMVFQTSDLPPS